MTTRTLSTSADFATSIETKPGKYLDVALAAGEALDDFVCGALVHGQAVHYGDHGRPPD
jgi:hypothetical protein